MFQRKNLWRNADVRRYALISSDLHVSLSVTAREYRERNALAGIT
jgi:hypothetical protein